MPQLGATLSLQTARQSEVETLVLDDSSANLVSSGNIICVGGNKTFSKASVVPAGATVNYSYLSGPASFSGGVNSFNLVYTGIGQIAILQVVEGISESFSDGISVRTLDGVNC